MAIRYVRADITTLKVDAIVNSANPFPIIGSGCDSAIYEAAGEERLLKERKKIGTIEVGDAMATSGFDLCKIIIHTVGPNWIDGEHGEFEALQNCYRNSLELVLREQCRSVAFPLISTGVYGFPKDQALTIATNEINAFLNCVRTGEKLPSHIETVAVTARMMQAIYDSAEKHEEIRL